jgi:hypothetical protein
MTVYCIYLLSMHVIVTHGGVFLIPSTQKNIQIARKKVVQYSLDFAMPFTSAQHTPLLLTSVSHCLS